jgi:hypothetical protein
MIRRPVTDELFRQNEGEPARLLMRRGDDPLAAKRADHFKKPPVTATANEATAKSDAGAGLTLAKGHDSQSA